MKDSRIKETTISNLTEDQRKQLDSGLRILARMIARAYLEEQSMKPKTHDEVREAKKLQNDSTGEIYESD